MVSGRLNNQANGSNTSVTLDLSVNGRPLSATATPGFVPPAPETGSPACAAFPISLDSAGFTTLYPGQTNYLDITGLNPQKVYEIALYSDRGTGDRSTGNLLSYTISSALSFSNASAVAPPWSVISGAQSETVTIDVTDNGRADRGYVCRFTGVQSGSDGAGAHLTYERPRGLLERAEADRNDAATDLGHRRVRPHRAFGNHQRLCWAWRRPPRFTSVTA